MYMLIHAYFLIHLLPRLAPDENFQSLATQGARAVIFVGQQICRQIADDALVNNEIFTCQPRCATVRLSFSLILDDSMKLKYS